MKLKQHDISHIKGFKQIVGLINVEIVILINYIMSKNIVILQGFESKLVYVLLLY